MNKTIYSNSIRKPSIDGFSLFELLTILSLLSIMLSFWVLPIYQKWLLDLQLKIQAHRLLDNIRFARNLAIQQHKQVLLAACKKDYTNSKEWKEGWVILGKDSVTGTYSQLLYRYTGLKATQSLRWHGARGTENLQLTSAGTSLGYNGHFTLCYAPPHQNRVSYVIDVSATGRARLTCLFNQFIS